MSHIESIRLPGLRWKRWAAWRVDDMGEKGPVVVMRTEAMARNYAALT